MFGLAACQPATPPASGTQPSAAAPTHTPASAPTLGLATYGASLTPRPTATPSSTPKVAPTKKPTPCGDAACAAQVNHLWLERPVPVGGYENKIEDAYPYGSTQDGLREPHHGVEFFNPKGTPILAAGAGEVVVAGPDDEVAYGRFLNFYGNLVVVRLDQTYNGQPVYTLYGHMLEITVQVGDKVQAGDFLGTVGSTGIAIGAHLHFEVRVGKNDYASTRNPELWLRPLPLEGTIQRGVVAGRVVDTTGKLVPEVTIVLRPVNVQADYIRNFYFATYALDPDRINGDDQLQENFAITDIPPGTYTLSVNTTKFYQETIVVEPGKIAWQTFRVAPLPPTPEPSDTLEFVPTPETTPGVDLTPGAEGSGTPSGEVTPTTETTPTAEATPTPEPPTAIP